MEVQVNAAGPMFTGVASARVARWTAETLAETARWADDEVHRVLAQVLRHPTGYYESRVHVEASGPDRLVITDGGVVYGPWLEGVGSRNYPVTRFKGYSTFRRVKQRVEARADREFRRVLGSRVREL